MLEQHVIETPDNISFGYQVAGIGSRFLAALIDSLIQGAIYLFLFVIFILVTTIGPSLKLSAQIMSWLSTVISIVIVVALFLIQFGYYIVLEIVTRGRSPGKELLGLSVIKENGYPLTPMDSIIRNLVRIVDFLPFAYGVGIIAMFLNDRAKRLGDMAAGTLVVQMGKSVKLSDLQSTSILPNTVVPAEAETEWPGMERLREADIELVEAYLVRRRTLRNADELGKTIVQRIVAQAGTHEAKELAAQNPPEVFLKRVANGFRTRQSQR
jgi:uncharacterized RDD family membrane protein YckC